ncbi:conserved hypothetical protein [Trichinella spiralis]|uniref:hypothetical protein n=1 Tax=Trichinella spiralis TaxID=6334 RepID=UPI0001EFEE8A|nr:conserved hypothetical protein [Trichinella spiralis]
MKLVEPQKQPTKKHENFETCKKKRKRNNTRQRTNAYARAGADKRERANATNRFFIQAKSPPKKPTNKQTNKQQQQQENAVQLTLLNANRRKRSQSGKIHRGRSNLSKGETIKTKNQTNIQWGKRKLFIS